MVLSLFRTNRQNITNKAPLLNSRNNKNNAESNMKFSDEIFLPERPWTNFMYKPNKKTDVAA